MVDDRPLPATIGPYRILQRLGSGGMGVVYLGEQRGSVARRVAVKLIKAAISGEEAMARFEIERHALSLMSHPNVATVHDAGTTTDGEPWFSMEYVPGVPMHAFCERQKLDLRQRLRLIQQVCHGIEHAHHKGIIHRDVKPTNILVSLEGNEPIAKIIDFGLARAVDRQPIGDRPLHTEFGRSLGTYEYMSPEQVEMSHLDIDTRTDIFAIGVTMYHVLVGELPFDGATYERRSPLEMRAHILDSEPPRPSTRARQIYGSTVAEHRRTSGPQAYVRHLRGEVDWIVMRAMEKDRTRRYQTPRELADDIERFLCGEAVLAGPPTATYRIAKALRRHRTAAMSLAAIFLVSLASALVFFRLFRDAENQRRELDHAIKDRDAAENREREILGRYRDLQFNRNIELVERQARTANWEPIDSNEMAILQLRDVAQRWRDETIPRLDRRIDDFPVDAAVSDEDAYLLEALRDTRARAERLANSLAARTDRWFEVRDDRRYWHRSASEDRGPTGWTSTLARIRDDERYRSCIDTAMFGWLPLGPSASGYEEFALIGTGRLPVRDTRTSELVLGDDAALVFVLIPGTERFYVGAQSISPPPDREQPSEPTSALRYDPEAWPNEFAGSDGPYLPTARLRPFLLAKFEMTQGQWTRLTGSNPSRDHIDPAGAQRTEHPVENVSWTVAEGVLATMGLVFPTEAQWEYACRAGTETPYWTGVERTSLLRDGRGVENLADGFHSRDPTATQRDARLWPDYDDGYYGHAPVGRFPPNAFGLHDMAGNVSEWCRDPYEDFRWNCFRDGDGMRADMDLDTGRRVVRGGNFARTAELARSAKRQSIPPASAYDNVGVRPVYPLPEKP